MTEKKLKISGVIFARFEDYEKRLNSGWYQQMIVDELKKEGFDVSLKYFSRCFSKTKKIKISSAQCLIPAPSQPINTEIEKPKGTTPKGEDKFKLLVLKDEELF